jgi:MraZ protein
VRIPAHFFTIFKKNHDNRVYITSLTGESAEIYPLKVWEEKERSNSVVDDFEPNRRLFDIRTASVGQEATLDSKGRVRLPQELREAAHLSADVAVLGMLNRLEVWDLQKLREMNTANPWTSENAEKLTRLKQIAKQA